MLRIKQFSEKGIMKKNKKIDILDATISLGGVGVGSAVGSHLGGLKSEKYLDKAIKIGKESLKRTEKNAKDVDSLKRLMNDPDMKGYKKEIQKEIKGKIESIKNNIARSERAIKIAKKKTSKNIIKGGLKGAGVGALVAGSVIGGKKIYEKSKEKKFSRHTPKDLERYKHDRLSDKELKKMSDGEIDDMIDEDSERATRNTSRYISKKAPKYLATGIGVGTTAGALIGGKGKRLPNAAVGAGIGSILGMSGASIRGTQKATEEGHGRRYVSKKAARRADKVKGGNAYSRMKEREDRRIQQQLDRERNAALWSNARANRGW